MSRYLRPPNTSLFVRNVADDTRYVQGRHSEPKRGGRGRSERTGAAAAARWACAGGGEGLKMAGPALAFWPELGRAAGITAAWERGRRRWSSRAAAGERAAWRRFGPQIGRAHV